MNDHQRREIVASRQRYDQEIEDLEEEAIRELSAKLGLEDAEIWEVWNQ